MKSKSSIASRNTRQKDAIRAAFVDTDRPLSPEEVLSYAQRAVADIGIAISRRWWMMDGWSRSSCPANLPVMSSPEKNTTITSFATIVTRSTNLTDASRRSIPNCLVDFASSVMILFFTASVRHASQGMRNDGGGGSLCHL